jgi:hypothetical protein
LLYRYRKLDADTLKREANAIAENYIWSSNYRDLNDPMEGFFASTKRVKQKQNYAAISQQILDEKQQIGICCFSDSRYSELMWAHYASNYQGICVGYRPKALLSALPDTAHLLRLSYGGRPPLVGLAQSKDTTGAARIVLSHKKDSWSYEREWRVLGPLGQVELQVPCVSEICFGLRSSSTHRQYFAEALKHLNIKLFVMTVTGYRHRFAPTK